MEAYVTWVVIFFLLVLLVVFWRISRQSTVICVTPHVSVSVITESVFLRRLGEIEGELRKGWIENPFLKDLDGRFEFRPQQRKTSGFYVLDTKLFHNNIPQGIVLQVYMDQRNGAVIVLFPDGKQSGRIATSSHAVTAAATFLTLYTPAEYGYVQEDA